MEEGDGEAGKSAFAKIGARNLKAQNLISILTIIFGFSLLLYFSRHGIIRELAHSPDLFAAVMMLVVVNSILFLSLTQVARAFINRHGKSILKIGLAMLLFSLLSPMVLLCGIFLIEGNSERLLPDRVFEILVWGNVALGFCGILVAIIPAEVKFFDYLRTTNK